MPSTSVEAMRKYRESLEQILEKVIRPVSGPLDNRVQVAVSLEPPLLTLEHTATTPSGTERTFRYDIHIAETAQVSSETSRAGDPRVLHIPTGPYTERELSKLQDAFRRACIDDPVLYGRFSRKDFKLEDYQESAIQAGLIDLQETGRALLVLGTGAGKTEIAFELASRELASTANLEETAVLFIVNNNIILAEAGDKFKRRFENQYSKSHAHGGQRDTSGHVVFTTPGTILGEQRLEDFLATKKQVLLIFDEVHHVVASQPTEIIERASDFANKNGIKLSVLGMTATETRPDLQSVLAYFNHRISFEMSALELTARGFLAPFRYHAADMWLHPGGKAPAVILPTDDIASDRRQLLNSVDAFPQIEVALDNHVLVKEDQRTLIVAPSIELAGGLVEYLDRNPNYSGKVVRLTSVEKGDKESNLRFSHVYQAWKTGAWPPHSPFSHEPVPTIVVAVDLFKEGADAPGVRTLINWADTNSLIVFLQTLGRGLRPDTFKECLDVIDIAGTFRKVHLLQWLGDITGARECESGANRSEGHAEAHNERIDGGQPSLCQLSEEVSTAVHAFLADVPQTLARRYPGAHYSAIPLREIERLHECLSSRLGFATVIDFECFMKELGTELVQNESSITVDTKLRERLAPAFFNNSSDVHSQFIPHERATLLVHAHLLQTLQTHVPDLEAHHFARLFPEFSKEAIDSARTIGSNLSMLRRRHFGLTPFEMITELRTKVVAQGKLSRESKAELGFASFGVDKSDIDFCMEAIERGNGMPDQIDQRALMLAYLEHPDLVGKLMDRDFRLPHKDFENLLIERGLITPRTEHAASHTDFLRLFGDRLTGLADALESGDAERLDKATGVAWSLSTSPKTIAFFDKAKINQHRFKSLELLRTKLATYPCLDNRLNDIYSSLECIFAKICARTEGLLPGERAYSVAMQQKPGALHLDLVVRPHHSVSENDGFEVRLPLKQEFSRYHVVVPSDAGTQLASLAQELPERGREALAQIVSHHLQIHAKRLAEVDTETAEPSSLPVIVLPRGPFGASESFQARLFDQLIKTTNLNVLIGGATVSGQPGAYNLRTSITDALASRVSEVSADSIKSARMLAKVNSEESFTSNLVHAYEVLQFARTRISPHISQWKQLFEDHLLDANDLRYLEISKQPLLRLLAPHATIAPLRLSQLKLYCDLLDHVYQAGGFTRDSVLLLATWTVYDEFPFRAHAQRQSPIHDLTGPLSTFFWRLTQAQSLGLTIPIKEHVSMREFLTPVFESLNGANPNQLLELHGVPPSRQKEEVQALKSKIETISTTLNELISGALSRETVLSEASTEARTRAPGYPFFNTDKEPVFFLSGSKKSPMIHIDPDCPVLRKDVEKRKRPDLPPGPVTEGSIESAIGQKEKAQCCRACQTPTWNERKHYRDVNDRFKFDPLTSVTLSAI